MDTNGHPLHDALARALAADPADVDAVVATHRRDAVLDALGLPAGHHAAPADVAADGIRWLDAHGLDVRTAPAPADACLAVGAAWAASTGSVPASLPAEILAGGERHLARAALLVAS